MKDQVNNAGSEVNRVALPAARCDGSYDEQRRVIQAGAQRMRQAIEEDAELERQRQAASLERLARWESECVDHSGLLIPSALLPTNPFLRQVIQEAFANMRLHGYLMVHGDMSHQPAPDQPMDVPWALRCWLAYWLYELVNDCPSEDPVVNYVGVLVRPHGVYYVFTAPLFAHRLQAAGVYSKAESSENLDDVASALWTEYATRAAKYGRPPAQPLPLVLA